MVWFRNVYLLVIKMMAYLPNLVQQSTVSHLVHMTCSQQLLDSSDRSQTLEDRRMESGTQDDSVIELTSTVKPVLSSHSKIDKTNVSKTNGSLMKIKSIAECSLGAFCNTFDIH